MPIHLILVLLFSIGILLYLFELIWIWYAAAQVDSDDELDVSTPITLLIAARDEEKRLRENLDVWLNQNHNAYELLIVNDCSDDDSEYLLAEYQRKYPHLQVLNLQESAVFKGGKKLALTLGIKGAQFERILFTDADCLPSSQDWLARMNARFDEEAKIVLGVGLYEKQRGFLNYLIRMDAFQIAIQYMGLAQRGRPYMGVGRNLAYARSVFFENDGFKSHQAILSGDDDLFINEVANAQNCVAYAHPDAITISEPRTSFSSWFRQKRRHMSTAARYSFSSKLILMLKPLRITLFYSAFILMLSLTPYTLSAMLSFLVLYIGHVLIFLNLNKKYGKVDLYFLYPFTEILLFVIGILIYSSTWLRKPTKWT